MCRFKGGNSGAPCASFPSSKWKWNPPRPLDALESPDVELCGRDTFLEISSSVEIILVGKTFATRGEREDGPVTGVGVDEVDIMLDPLLSRLGSITMLSGDLGFKLGNGEGGTNGKAARTLSVRDVELAKDSRELLRVGGGRL